MDVVNGRVQEEAFRDKIVLLGVTLTGLGEQNVTPRSPRATDGGETGRPLGLVLADGGSL